MMLVGRGVLRGASIACADRGEGEGRKRKRRDMVQAVNPLIT